MIHFTRGAAFALLFASAAHAVPILPPEEYDHPFKGRLTAHYEVSQENLRRHCLLPGAKLILGCSSSAGYVRCARQGMPYLHGDRTSNRRPWRNLQSSLAS